MKLSIDHNDSRSLYQQIADGIKAHIASGQLSEGHKLPPIREMAGNLGVTLNTVAQGYRILQQEGLVEIHHGTGAMVSRRKKTAPSNDRHLEVAVNNLRLQGLSESQVLAAVKRVFNKKSAY